MNWNSTAVLESKYDPSVRITIKRFSQRRRAMLELELAEYQAMIREKTIDYAETAVINQGMRDNDGNLVPGDDGKPVDPGDSEYIRAQKTTRHNAYIRWIQSNVEAYLKVPTLRAYISKVEGLTIDGKPAGVEELIADGPEELSDEIYMFIVMNGKLKESDYPNSQSPFTSPEVEGGQTNSTTAAVA